jgi:hypothetical protein
LLSGQIIRERIEQLFQQPINMLTNERTQIKYSNAVDNKAAAFASSDNLETILTLFDAAFVKGAYRLILGREPDASGFSHYLRQIRAGQSKESIISEIATSTEAQQRQTKHFTPSKEPASKKSLFSRFTNILTNRAIGTARDSELRQLRAIENLVAKSTVEVLEALEEVKSLQKQITILTEVLEIKASGRHPGIHLEGDSNVPVSLPRNQFEDIIDSSTQDILAKLKSAINS